MSSFLSAFAFIHATHVCIPVELFTFTQLPCVFAINGNHVRTVQTIRQQKMYEPHLGNLTVMCLYYFATKYLPTVPH